jgi:hypothetical protein
MKNFLVLLSCILSCYLNAQDILFKTNGDTVAVKVLEVGTNAVSYKKFNYLDGPVFVENKENIRMIRFSNGDVQQFNQANPLATKTDSIKKTDPSATQNTNSQQSNTQGTQNQKIKIEHVDNKFTIDGKPAKKKEVDKQLSSSKNPAIPLLLKTAKITSTAQKIVKITSYPTTIGGGAAFLVKGIDLWNDIQRGRTTSKSYTNALWSMLTTISLPITNKILKKKSDKMYDKLIDMYNVTN